MKGLFLLLVLCAVSQRTWSTPFLIQEEEGETGVVSGDEELSGAARAIPGFPMAHEFDPKRKGLYNQLVEGVLTGHEADVLEAIQKGADVNARGKDGWTPLMAAVGMGRMSIVRLLVDHGAISGVRTSKGWSTTMLAAYMGELEILQYLTDLGEPLTGKAGVGVDFLIRSSKFPRLETLVRGLMGYEADEKIKESMDMSILMLATYAGHEDIVVFLLEKGLAADGFGQGVTPLFWAILRSDLAIMKHLLNHGAKVDKRSSLGKTPLMFAAAFGRVECAQILIRAGADLNQPDVFHNLPLHYAISWKRRDVVNLLLKAGSTINRHNNRGDYPLTLAIRANDSMLVGALLMQGADVTLTADDGWTFLMEAVSHGSEPIVRRLLKASPPLNIQERSSGSSALLLAVEREHANLVKILVEQGADRNLKDINGVTALELAKRKNNRKLVALLL